MCKAFAVTEPSKEDAQTPVPEVWRPTLTALVESLRQRESVLGAGMPSVDAVGPTLSDQCRDAVDLYGEGDLVPLPPEAWDTSVAMWDGDGRSRCLVDLWTEAGRSDLVLDMTIREDAHGYRYAVRLVYVP
jgi:hypothetical protein